MKILISIAIFAIVGGPFLRFAEWLHREKPSNG
jgi:hypothetical protein